MSHTGLDGVLEKMLRLPADTKETAVQEWRSALGAVQRSGVPLKLPLTDPVSLLPCLFQLPLHHWRLLPLLRAGPVPPRLKRPPRFQIAAAERALRSQLALQNQSLLRDERIQWRAPPQSQATWYQQNRVPRQIRFLPLRPGGQVSRQASSQSRACHWQIQ